MTVETNARFLSDLNESYPRSQDLIKEGDDHIRLIKSVVKNTFPGFNSSTSITSDKLNKVDKSLTYEGDTVVINNDVKFSTGKRLNLNSNRIVNLADPVDDTDAVSLKFVKNSVGGVAWPVNSIFITTDDRNPADLLGIGTWERVSQGRMLVGVGTTTDSNGLQKTFQNGSTGGEYYHTITVDEAPSSGGSSTTTALFKESDLLPPTNVPAGSTYINANCSVSGVYKAGTKVRIRGTAIGEGQGVTSLGITLRVRKGGAVYSEKSYAVTVDNSSSSEVTGSTLVLLQDASEYTFETLLYNPYSSGSVLVRNATIEVSEVL